MPDYEHSEAMREAYEAATLLRKRIKRLHWIAGGRGYDNMGKRELEQARNRADETVFWIAAASKALNAGAERARSLGYKRLGAGDAHGGSAENSTEQSPSISGQKFDALQRVVLWLDRLDERVFQPTFERALDRFDRVFGGGSGPYE